MGERLKWRCGGEPIVSFVTVAVAVLVRVS